MENEVEAIEKAVDLAYECYGKNIFKHAANIYKRCFPKYDAYTAIIALLSNHMQIREQKDQIVDIVGEEGYNLIDGLIYWKCEAYDDFGVAKTRVLNRKSLDSYYEDGYYHSYLDYIKAIMSSGQEVAIHVMQEKFLYCWQNRLWCGQGVCPGGFCELKGKETECHTILETLFPDGKY